MRLVYSVAISCNDNHNHSVLSQEGLVRIRTMGVNDLTVSGVIIDIY